MDIFGFIEQDHQKVMKLFQQLHNAKSSAKNRQQLFAQLKEELEFHTHTEEQVFYPALQESDGLHDMVLDAQEDHRLVSEMLEKLASTSETDEEWDERLQTLQENVEGHVADEESKIFEAARQLLGSEQARRLAEDRQRVKQEQMMTRASR
jgi:iron-sulfur cluster repair protein YtfE (RIC family)